jgi:hypothetical protein
MPKFTKISSRSGCVSRSPLSQQNRKDKDEENFKMYFFEVLKMSRAFVNYFAKAMNLKTSSNNFLWTN